MCGGNNGRKKQNKTQCPCLPSHLAHHLHRVNQNHLQEQRLAHVPMGLMGEQQQSPSALTLPLISHFFQAHPSQGTVRLQSQGPWDEWMTRCLRYGRWEFYVFREQRRSGADPAQKLGTKTHSHRPSDQDIPQEKGRLGKAGLLKLVGLKGDLILTQVKRKG